MPPSNQEYSDIIDNRRRTLLQALQGKLKGSQRASFAVGYLFISGLKPLQGELTDFFKQNGAKLRLLMGNTTDRNTIEGLMAIHNHQGYLEITQKKLYFQNKTERQTRVDATQQAIDEGLSLMEQNSKTESVITQLANAVIDEKLAVKVYTHGPLHSKAYIFDYKPEFAEVSQASGAGYVGSSNLSLSGLGEVRNQTELNVQVRGNLNHKELIEWFDDLWKEAEPFDESLLESLKKSWALNIVSPFDLYYKTLYEIVRNVTGKDKFRELERHDFPDLLRFQEEAVDQAIRILRDYGGVFIADVVGLGKTFIGLALLKYYSQTLRYTPLVICPKGLVQMWKKKCQRYKIPATVVSMGILSQKGVNLSQEYPTHNVVLIDESHHFRYPNINRYRALAPYTQSRRVIMLTATPQNKDARDILNQIKLFHPEDQTLIPINPPNFKKFFKLVDKQEVKLKELLRHILIRRTRYHIKKWYRDNPEGDEGPPYIIVDGKKNYFPEREIETINYSIDDVYEGLYDDIMTNLERLSWARYDLGTSVKDDKKQLKKYKNLENVSDNIRHLIRTSLFKRFESSVAAFRLSIKRMIKAHTIIEAIIDKYHQTGEGYIPLGREVQRILYGADDEVSDEELIEEMEDISQKYPAEDFKCDELKEKIHHDLLILDRIFGIVKPIEKKDDDKLQEFRKLIKEKIKNNKVLIFSQFADTVNYLKDGLSDLHNLEHVTSKRENQMDILHRFAPIANKDLGKLTGPEIQILLASDVFSEGLNLQDCGIVINYDLHWNHVRLIQRIGRIDRIGSRADKILVYNFLPERKLEEKIRLKERLQERIKEFNRALGNDAPILEKNEEINLEAMYAIYTGDIDSIEREAERSDPSDFTDIYQLVNKYEQFKARFGDFSIGLEKLPLGLRARDKKKSKGHFAYFRHGDFEQFYLSDNQGYPKPVDIDEALSALYVAGKGLLKKEPNQCTGDFRVNQPIPTAHFDFLAKAREQFSNLVNARISKYHQQHDLSLGQSYIKDQLMAYSKLIQNQEERNKIDQILSVILKPQSFPILKQLNSYRREGIKGKDLVHAVASLILDHKLHRQDDRPIDEWKPIKLVTSEYFG